MELLYLYIIFGIFSIFIFWYLLTCHHKWKFVDVRYEEDYDEIYIKVLFICEKCNKIKIKKFYGQWSEEKIKGYFNGK